MQFTILLTLTGLLLSAANAIPLPASTSLTSTTSSIPSYDENLAVGTKDYDENAAAGTKDYDEDNPLATADYDENAAVGAKDWDEEAEAKELAAAASA